MSKARRLEFDDLWTIAVPEASEISPDGTQVVYVVRTPDRSTDGYTTSIWLAAADGGSNPVQLTQGPKDAAPRWSPDGSQIAFLAVRGGSDKPQVHVLPVAGAGEARRVTDLPLGAGAPVWSPDGKRLAFTAGVDLLGPPADDKERKRRAAAPLVIDRLGYKSDGAGLIRSLRSHLFVTGIEKGSIPVQLTWGDWFAGGAAWSSDGETLVVSGSRGENSDLEPTSRLYAVAAEGGGTPRPLTPDRGFAGDPVFTADGRIVFTGKADAGPGLARLFVVPAEGGDPVELAPAFDRNVMSGSPGYPGGPLNLTDDGRLFFCARDRGATHIYALALDGDGTPRKVLGQADNSISGLSVAGRTGALTTVLSDRGNPGEVAVLPARTAAPILLTTLSADSLKGVDLFLPEERTFTAPDGTEIHGWIVRGAAADKPGPLLLDIHGGPHNAWGPTFDNKHHHHQVLAADGWTVLYVNPRGSDGYGEDFMTAVSGAWGTSDTDDFLCAVDALIDEGIVDRSQVAVTGYSYGGYMTCWLTATTDRFAAGVTGAPCSSLVSEAGSADMGLWLARHEVGALPWEDPELYKRHDPQAHVHRVTCPTLILHGESDDRCPVGQAEEWFTGLRANGVPVEMVRYPGCSHLFIVNGRPSHRIDYGRRVADWVREHVGPNAAVGSRPKRRDVLAAYSSRLDSLARTLNIPGVSVALLHDGVVETAWAGVLHAERPDQVTEDSRFQIGSITKVFTTALLMQLVDEGKLDLDTPVVTYLPEFKLADAEATQKITTRHLLAHINGIPGDWFPDLGDSATAEQFVATLADFELAHPVGQHFDYSNSGFTVAGRLVEVLTGQPWGEVLSERIIEPLGIEMAASGNPVTSVVGLAMGHVSVDPSEPLGKVKPAPRYATHPESASVGSTPIATARALIGFARMFIEDGRASDGTEVLSPSAVKQMAERQVEVPPAGLAGRAWRGLGWGIGEWDGEIVLQHSGGTLGQSSRLTVLPDRGVAVAILTNGPAGGLLARAVETDLFSETTGLVPPPPPAPGENPPKIEPALYAGTYECIGARIEVTPGDAGGLSAVVTSLGSLDPKAEATALPAFTLKPVDGATFAAPDGSVVSFVEPGEGGRYQYLFTGRLHRRTS
ncbi:MAG TPA: serine hydrolase [Acidimicrobiales bacterium]|nr:serine hydrolase [Acidimicrobiales bacterium]